MVTTIKEWVEDPSLRVALRQLMSESPLQDAIEVLLKHNIPKWSAAPQGVDQVTLAAVQHARNSGFYDFYRALVRLTEEPHDVQSKLPEPWAKQTN